MNNGPKNIKMGKEFLEPKQAHVRNLFRNLVKLSSETPIPKLKLSNVRTSYLCYFSTLHSWINPNIGHTLYSPLSSTSLSDKNSVQRKHFQNDVVICASAPEELRLNHHHHNHQHHHHHRRRLQSLCHWLYQAFLHIQWLSSDLRHRSAALQGPRRPRFPSLEAFRARSRHESRTGSTRRRRFSSSVAPHCDFGFSFTGILHEFVSFFPD